MVFVNPAPTLSTALVAFPGLVVPLNDKRWKLYCSGVVFQPSSEMSLRQRMLVRMLGRLMNASPEDLESPLFRERIQPFLAEGIAGRTVVVSAGFHQVKLANKTGRAGQFHEWLTLDGDQLLPLVEIDDQGREFIKLQFRVPGEPDLRTQCSVFLQRPEGISVISDIDDTIKESFVVDRRELLNNTFLKEFQVVDGMAQVYSDWSLRGAAFHYVSSSPWQLYEPLLAMNRRANFPHGTLHLKSFRFRDHFFRRVNFTKQAKSAVIRLLLHHLPQRRFILIGDSGEKDPEIYAKIARKFQHNIRGIFIRDLSKPPSEFHRWDRLRASLGVHRFSTFQTAPELNGLVQDLF